MHLVVFRALNGRLLRNVRAIQLAEKVRYTLEAAPLRRVRIRRQIIGVGSIFPIIQLTRVTRFARMDSKSTPNDHFANRHSRRPNQTEMPVDARTDLPR